MSIELFIAFVGATALVFLTPGPSMVLILANSATHGIRAGIVTVLGNAFGFMVLLALILAGLHLIVRHFESWFPIVRFAGAAYLFWLGVRFYRRSVAEVPQPEGAAPHQAQRNHFLGGIVVAFANPTALLFLAALLPQFITAGSGRLTQSAVLAAVFISVCIFVQTLLAVAANQAGQWLLSGKARLLDKIAAVALMLGGLMLVVAGG
jgi:threonine/homoserine/homoserine lactone efflux protein